MKRRIVLLGPPASWKGALAELIRNRFEIPASSMGAIQIFTIDEVYLRALTRTALLNWYLKTLAN